jgi:hypothetical protein
MTGGKQAHYALILYWKMADKNGHGIHCLARVKVKLVIGMDSELSLPF